MTFAPAQLEAAIARLEALPDPTAREAAREALSAVLELHGEGLRRLSERLREATPDGDRIFHAAVQDEVVASLFLLHGIHPLPLETRVDRALDGVRASEHGEGSRIDVVSIDQSAVQLRVTGSERLRSAVARAVEAVAPEVERIDVLSVDPTLVPLEKLVRRREANHEHCDLCGAAIHPEHEHLFDIERRKLECACAACAVLFDASATKVRRVRRQALRLDGFRISDAQWEALKVPVGLAFFCRSSALDEVIAAYPSPGGAVESVVSKAAWEDLVKDNVILAELDSDTSALLVDRLSARPTYHILSIDECYRLTGLVRRRWQGLTGGDGPVGAIEEFFDGLLEVHA